MHEQHFNLWREILLQAYTGWHCCWCSHNYRYFLSVLLLNVFGLVLPANKPEDSGTKYHSGVTALSQSRNCSSNPVITDCGVRWRYSIPGRQWFTAIDLISCCCQLKHFCSNAHTFQHRNSFFQYFELIFIICMFAVLPGHFWVYVVVKCSWIVITCKPHFSNVFCICKLCTYEARHYLLLCDPLFLTIITLLRVTGSNCSPYCSPSIPVEMPGCRGLLWHVMLLQWNLMWKK